MASMDALAPMAPEALAADLAALDGFDEGRLYAEIERAEEAMKELQLRRGGTEEALQRELGRLSSDLSMKRDQLRVAQLEARAADGSGGASSAELRRRVAALGRGTQAARFFAQRLQEQQANFLQALKDREKVRRLTADSKLAWQNSVGLLDALAMRVDDAETAHRLLVSENRVQKGKLKLVANTSTQEYKDLLATQERLKGQLRESRNAMELKRLMDEERDNDDKKWSAQLVVQDIAEVQEMTDVLERRSQQTIEGLRDALVGGADEEQALRRQKERLDESSKTLWTTVCDLRRRQLEVHQQTEEEDIITAQLEHRTDVLIRELKVLEDRMAALFDDWGQPNAAEARMEQEKMLDDLAAMRAKRRAVQHRLAFQLSRKAPLQEALKQCLEHVSQMEAKLKPIRGLLEDRPSG